MFVFQMAFAQKQQQEQEIFQPQQFLQSEMKEAEKLFEKKGYSNFLQTLTPGARNAIYAASFAWGFENASKALSSAMEQQEAKAESDKVSKSTSVVKSMCDSASENSLAQPQAVSFVWSFYNEDLKRSQATAAKSEIMVEGSAGERQMRSQQAGIADLQKQEQAMPQIVQTEMQRQMQETLSQCIEQGDLSRSFEACAALRVQQGAQKIEIEKAQQAKVEISEEKRAAMLAEYDKAISATEQKIGDIKNADAKDLQALEALVQKEPTLPQGMLNRLSSLKKEDRGKRAYLAMLKKELLSLQRGRSTLSSLTCGALSKMLSLKSLLGK